MCVHMHRRSSTALCCRLAEKHMEPYLASITDAQRALGIGRTTAYRLIGAGKLETVKIGRRTLIKIASIKSLAGEAQHLRQSDPE